MATPPPEMGEGESDFPPPDDYPPPPEQQAEYPPPPGEGTPPPAVEAPPHIEPTSAPAAVAGPGPEYPPPPPAKKSAGGLVGIFLKIGDIAGGLLPIIFTLAGFVLWGIGQIIVGVGFRAAFYATKLNETKSAADTFMAGSVLAGIGVILAIFGIMVLLLMIFAKKK